MLKTELSQSRRGGTRKETLKFRSMAEEENFYEDFSFVPYVIQMDNALDDEEGEEVKPSLPVGMIFDEVERRGPDKIIDLEEEQAGKDLEEMKSRPRRRKRKECCGKELEKEHSSIDSSKDNLESLKKKKTKMAKKRLTDRNKTNKEVVIVGASRVNGEQLLKDQMKLTKENQALRMKVKLNEDQLTRLTSENEILHAKLEKLEGENKRVKNIMKMERKRAKAIMELSSLSLQEVKTFSSFNCFLILSC